VFIYLVLAYVTPETHTVQDGMILTNELERILKEAVMD
jgi:hypothetical protein